MLAWHIDHESAYLPRSAPGKRGSFEPEWAPFAAGCCAVLNLKKSQPTNSVELTRSPSDYMTISRYPTITYYLIPEVAGSPCPTAMAYGPPQGG
jgi:hypothetical protein